MQDDNEKLKKKNAQQEESLKKFRETQAKNNVIFDELVSAYNDLKEKYTLLEGDHN